MGFNRSFHVDLTRNPGDFTSKLHDSEKRSQANEKSGKASQSVKAVSDEEITAFENQLLMMNNPEGAKSAAFMKDMSKEEKRAFIDTYKSIVSSFTEMGNGPWAADNYVAAAVYGQNQAKIEMADQVLKGHHTNQLTEVLDWYMKNLQEVSNNPFHEIDTASAAFKKIAKLFAQTSTCTNAAQFQQKGAQAFSALSEGLGNKYSTINRAAFSSSVGQIVGSPYAPSTTSSSYSSYADFLTKDWNGLIANLSANGVKQDFSNYLYQGIDVLA